MSEAQVETQEKEEIEGGERGIHLDERREDWMKKLFLCVVLALCVR
jgi:hypothetical protein